MGRGWLAAFAPLFMLICAQTARAEPEECQDALDAYNAAISDVESAKEDYNNCTSSHDGEEDCSSEFEGLKSAQDDLESAVTDYQGNCP